MTYQQSSVWLESRDHTVLFATWWNSMRSLLHSFVQCTLHTIFACGGMPWLWVVGGSSISYIGSRGMRVGALRTRKSQG